MQQKLDSFCEQVNSVRNQTTNEEASPEKSAVFPFNSNSESDLVKFIDCGCWLCDQHHKQLNMFVVNYITESFCVFFYHLVDVLSAVSTYSNSLC